MHFYQHHIGDFNSATRHLNLLERAIYRDLLDMYYEQETAIDGTNMAKLERRLCVRSTEEQRALKDVLDEYFENQENFYFNNRCEEEIKSYQEKVETAIKAGKASAEARRKKARKKQRKDTPNPNDNNVLNEKSTTVERPLNGTPTETQPTINHEPRTMNQEPIEKNSNNNKENSEVVKISDWKPPVLESINSMMDDIEPVTQSQYDKHVRKFTNYHTEQEAKGNSILTDDRRVDLLLEWIERDYFHQQKIKGKAVKPVAKTETTEELGYHPSHKETETSVEVPQDYICFVPPQHGGTKYPLFDGMTMPETYAHTLENKLPSETAEEAYLRLAKDMGVGV